MSQTAELALHPWNRAFSWEDRRPPFRRLTEAQVEQFDREGFVVVPGVFDRATIDDVVGEIDGFEAEVESFLQQREDGRLMIAESGAITFTTHLVTRSEKLKAFSRHPFFADVCADLVGPDVNLYWDQAVYKSPRSRGGSPGTRTTATPTSSRSSTSRAGSL
jgi:hypothetical protein